MDEGIPLSARTGDGPGRNPRHGRSDHGAPCNGTDWHRHGAFLLHGLVPSHIAYIIGKITAHIHSRRGAEFSIAGLVSLANLCTANNTIAIITAGPIAKEISDKFQIPPKRSASILDTFSCLVQGVIPYGAQMLMAAGISQVSPLLIMKYLYYPLILGICSTLAIALAPGGTERRRKR